MDFLTTKSIAACIEDIIKESNKFVTIVTPYLKIDETYIDRLNDACSRNVKIKIIYGKKDLTEEEKVKISRIKKVKLYFFENLHAKCYLNEKTALITSMNLYDFSERNNREMGIVLSKNDSKNIYDKILEEVNSIQNNANEGSIPNKHIPTLDSIPPFRKTYSNNYSSNRYGGNYDDSFDDDFDDEPFGDGVCIRCGDTIDFDPNRPLCYDCYMEWNQYGNPDYPEHVCHRCGREDRFGNITFARPLCRDCFFN